MNRTVGRFAPSPTGRMHLGNVLGALLSYLSAKSRGGEWVLRIEDIDRGRSRQEFVDLLREDLEFLGLEWDRYYVQSERYDIYEAELARLAESGLTYPCWCTRAEIMASSAPHESDGRVLYAGTCRDNEERRRENAGRPAATRIKVPDRTISFTDRHYGPQSVNLADECGDFILRRSDGSWAYQLAVVVDDALMGITEVVRGRDLLLSSAQQIFLFEALGYAGGGDAAETPAHTAAGIPEYAHFPLLCNAAEQRLCKRDKGLDMSELRRTHSAEQILGMLAFRSGIIDSERPCTVAELLPLFDWSKIPASDIICR